MDNSDELLNQPPPDEESGVKSSGDNTLTSPMIKDPGGLRSLDWSLINKFNEKWPLGAERLVKVFLFFLFVLNRIGSFFFATAFCVLLPLLPTILFVLKNKCLSRETLIITGIMQVLNFLNAENKQGGIAVFVGYVVGFAFCSYVQDWELPAVIPVPSWDNLFHYTFATELINGHLLDSFLIVGIMFVTGLNCLSVFKTYGIGFENHWFWEDMKRLCFQKEKPKELENKPS